MSDHFLPAQREVRIAVIGLGYVGLPLAVEFGRRFPTFGFDTNPKRISELASGYDHTHEVGPEELADAKQLHYCTDIGGLMDANVFIVTVPTPIDRNKRPDLGPLLAASRTVGSALSAGDVVIYESTVYPGATEEVCVPVLEEVSGLTFNKEFFVGYSPERINPGDKKHRLTDITKVTSASTSDAANFVDALYRTIIKAGTHLASSIKVAEAAKVIENTQRDLNIALVNELALIFERLNVDTEEVLAAASTKWNFLPFKPGLVGGHCVGVDPYYLTFKAEEVGYHPEIILAGRRINDSMGAHIAGRLVKLMARNRINIVGSRTLILGLTFKENCPDTRNTKVVDVISALHDYNMEVDVFDPWVDPQAARDQYGLELLTTVPQNTYDAIVIAVAHSHFNRLGEHGIKKFAKANHVLLDVKHLLPPSASLDRL